MGPYYEIQAAKNYRLLNLLEVKFGSLLIQCRLIHAGLQFYSLGVLGELTDG